MKLFLEKLKDSCIAVVPIVVIITLLGFFVANIDTMTMVKFFICTIIIIFGLTIFSIGIERSMIKIGDYIGSATSKTNNIFIMAIISLLVGFLFTIAEPDLAVLASQFPGLSSSMVLILVVSVGVGIFLALAVLRIIFKIKLSIILAVSYLVIIVLSFFVPKSFAPVAFDSSGIATGSLSVPFFIAFGLGISSMRSSGKQDDSFGLVSVASIGPIISIMIFSMFTNVSDVASSTTIIESIKFADIFPSIALELVANLKDVGVVLIPIFVIFFAFQIFKLHLPWKEILKIIIGILFAYVGMVLFLTGIQAGFLPVGSKLGFIIGNKNHSWILIPLSLLIGLFIVMAEPAVHVLNKQVEDITSGVINKKVMMICMCIGVSLSVCLAVLRCFFDINILWFMIPMFVISIILAFFVPPIFCGIAFDSGGVASGSMAAAFILPFINGICDAFNINSMYYGFGTLAIIGTMPTIIIECLGVVFSIVSTRAKTKQERKIKKSIKIIEFDYGE